MDYPPNTLLKDQQESLTHFLANEVLLNKLYVGDTYSSRTLVEIHDPFGIVLLSVKHIACLPSCKGIFQKVLGWIWKSSYSIKSSNSELFSSGYIQIKDSSNHFENISVFSESCEKILSLDPQGYSCDTSISGKGFHGFYFLNPDNKICSSIFDDRLNCKLYLSPEEDVPKFMVRKRVIYADKNLSSLEMTCLTLVALLPEISFRLMTGGEG